MQLRRERAATKQLPKQKVQCACCERSQQLVLGAMTKVKLNVCSPAACLLGTCGMKLLARSVGYSLTYGVEPATFLGT